MASTILQLSDSSKMTSCKQCNKGGISADNVALCAICDSAYCFPCSELLPTEQRVIQLKSPTTLLFCCKPCKVEIKKPLVVQVGFMKDQIKLLNDIIRDKEVIIKDKSTIIAHLEAEIVGRPNMQCDGAVGDANSQCEQAVRTAATLNNCPTTVKGVKSLRSVDQDNRIALKTLERKQREVMSEVIGLGRGVSNSEKVQEFGVATRVAPDNDDTTWKTASSKRKKKRTILGANTDMLPIAAVESRRNVFVSRLRPETTSEQIRKHLEDNKINPLEVEKLDIRSKDIAAFKIVIQQSDEKQASCCDLWPKYTIIRPYRQPRAFLSVGFQSSRAT